MTLPLEPRRILGAVLAGGAGRRFGSDKALAVLAGRPLIEHAARAVGKWASQVVVCGREFGGYASVADRPRPGLGPLGAINAALHLAAEQHMAGVLTIACDIPVLPDEVAARLLHERPAVAAGQPLLGYWPVALAEVLDAYLATAEDRSVWGWARHVGAVEVATAGVLANVNTPADLAELAEYWPSADQAPTSSSREGSCIGQPLTRPR
ncbi:molybdenum cofactor guanylyltransferase [Sphingomonas donggukensis]|uniref:Molybdenum cofactor guanylyltransferase n=1 Tax=Sphingomonas donggukensis TaxID=2949093 RepID=A0ABY4TVG9_9SPHN|nr:molybdenum cofactor guanylyltransferase [Sphingomonas donggukensis]URW76400.1 molybdenum cofactor guanylyltransferase [Sphingomonas donggukensis]